MFPRTESNQVFGTVLSSQIRLFLALNKYLGFAPLGKRLAKDHFTVDELIGEEDFRSIAVRVLNTDLNRVTPAIGLWQGCKYIKNYRDGLALVGTRHLLE